MIVLLFSTNENLIGSVGASVRKTGSLNPLPTRTVSTPIEISLMSADNTAAKNDVHKFGDSIRRGLSCAIHFSCELATKSKRCLVMDLSLLELICCPVTHQNLRLADEAELVSASARASRPITEGLVREDGNMLYPISDGIPLLVPEEGIPL